MNVFGYFFQKEHMLMAHQQKRSTSTEDFGGGGGGGAAASVPTREPVVVCKFYLTVHRFYARVQSPSCTTYGKA